MAESTPPSTPPSALPIGPTGAPATPPKVAPWLALYSLARVAIAAVLVAILWVAGLGGIPALLWGILLQLPIAYLALRPLRDRLTEALAARAVARRAAKADLRARLSGTED
jgi:hypothetical protein